MKRYLQRLHCAAFALAAVLGASCKQKEKFPDLGLKFSGPIPVVTDDTGKYFYVLNTDLQRDYNKASIVVLDEDGTKLTAVDVPRMGRMMAAAGNHLIVGYDREDVDGDAKVELYDISTPSQPVKTQEWLVNAVPLNAYMVKDKNYKNFAVTLTNGELHMGVFNDDGTAQLIKVREYSYARRALYIDTKRDILFAFSTDLAAPSTEDRPETYDQNTYDANAVLTEPNVPNDIPDNMENTTKAQRAENSNRQLYQFVLYDIGVERANGFPFHALDDVKDKFYANRELRWLYFTLTSQDGIPDNGDEYDFVDRHTYRTNIWDAVADPNDPDAFLFSQRGGVNGNFANNVVRAHIRGNYKASDTGKVPRTKNYLTFERVYGFAGEVSKKSYPGNLALQNINGLPMLFVTDSRDPVYWNSDNREYSLTTKSLDGTEWYSKETSDDFHRSFYGVAVNERGVGFATSFYGSSVYRFTAAPGVVPEFKEIN